MNEKDNFALVPRPPGAVDKAEPGAKRIMPECFAPSPKTVALILEKSWRQFQNHEHGHSL
jgi:hypothetical protein